MKITIPRLCIIGLIIAFVVILAYCKWSLGIYPEKTEKYNATTDEYEQVSNPDWEAVHVPVQWIFIGTMTIIPSLIVIIIYVTAPKPVEYAS